MEKCNAIGLDISKHSFEVCVVGRNGKILEQKTLKRNAVLTYFAKHEASHVALEACGGAHYWARTIESLNHKVSIIPPQYVKPFVITNKSDRNDAHAIARALREPSIPKVAIASKEAQDLQALHRVRQRLVHERVALINQIRGLLLEYGIILPQGFTSAKKRLSHLIHEKPESLSLSFTKTLSQEYSEWLNKDKLVDQYTKHIESHVKQSPCGVNLMQLPGIGPLTASGILIKLHHKEVYRNGRHFAASLGLVPRHEGTGGKIKIKGISKRGDTYLRTLLIHGARTVIQHRKKNPDALRMWVNRIVDRRGVHKACVALANKHARIAWRIVVHGESYKADCAAKVPIPA